ncbi:hypothetical protein JST97_10570 [bacterium]|nr:hypothetical protein [bacterium]
MENQSWREQIPEVDHMHRLLHHSLQGDMPRTDKEAGKDPRRWFDQQGSLPKHPKEK